MRKRGYKGKILCLGFYGTNEQKRAERSGVDLFVEEDEIDYGTGQEILCRSIRYLSECIPFDYSFPGTKESLKKTQ